MNKTPKLRFKEFSGDWEVKKLGELGEFFKGSTLSKANLSEDGKPCILYGELYTKYGEVIKNTISKTNLNDSKLVIGKKNDVLIPSSGESAIDIATASCLQQDDVILGGDLNVFRSDKLNGVFASYQLNNSKRHEIAKLAQGASVVHVYNTQLSKLKLSVPSKEEQGKIASLFSLIDDKTSLQSEKVDALKDYKSSMIQKFFNRTLRFKDDEGRDYPEWEEGKVKDIITEHLYQVDKPLNAYWRLGLRSHGKGTFHEYVTDPSKISMDKLYEVKKNMLIVNITFAWEHAIAVTNSDDEGKLVSHRFPTYDFNDNAIYNFYKYYILLPKFKYCLMNASPGGAGRNRVLNKKQFLQIPVPIPCIEEQNKIANILNQLDIKIVKEQEKLDSLNEYKKGLLQQMFV
ncbi:MAG: restriction endonuclease subunit S [Paraclostridium sp.]